MANLPDVRRAIVKDVLKSSKDGKVPHERIWKRYTSNVALGVLDGAPENERERVAVTAKRIGVSKSLVQSLLDEGHLTRRSARIKPVLSEKQRAQRVSRTLLFLDEKTCEFEPMYDIVHIDEKWFNEDIDGRSYLLLPNEEPPQRHCRSKRHMPKTMFLAAVARPRYDYQRKTMFDGKLRIWPLVEHYTAQRNSRNRPAGTVLTKIRNIPSIDRGVIKEFLLTAVIPAIKTKWPARHRGRNILIQQDNAKLHDSSHGPDDAAAGTADGWNICMFPQPANLPDGNVLDLGFFTSIQNIQIERPIYSTEALITAVIDAYNRLSSATLDDVFLSLQNVMICILQSKGGNAYMLPHMGKQKLRREGRLP
ncbi:Mar9 Transposase [Phytophthora megakarya]|uniref:Mar9 Transposase n=1 Tax=Phytophthora megakarya TaxID=4795 RepID=A0A225WZV1_9STRA|nr:Mar9 Transposase [Phytophthora megakarya]